MLVLVTYDVPTVARVAAACGRLHGPAWTMASGFSIPYSSVTSIRPSGLPYVPACAT